MQQQETIGAAVEKNITEDILLHFSTTLEQSPSSVKLAIEQLIGVVISALRDRVVRPNGEEAIWTLTEQAHQSDALHHLLTPDSFGGRGVRLMQGLLPDTYEFTIQRIATGTGLPLASLPMLIEVAVAAVLGTLGQLAATTSLDAAGLSQWLQQVAPAPAAAPVTSRPPVSPPAPTLQERPAPKPVPKPISKPVAPTFRAAQPTPQAGPLPPPVAPSASSATESPEKETFHRFTVAGAGTWEKIGGGITFTPASATSWLGRARKLRLLQRPRSKWLLAMPAVGLVYLLGYLGGYFILSSPEPSASAEARVKPEMRVATVADRSVLPRTKAPVQPAEEPLPNPKPASVLPAGHYDPISDTYIYTTGEPLVLTLPDGSRQRVGSNSTEYRLYSFLADPTKQVDTLHPAGSLLNLDRVYFTSGNATLTEESQQQIKNLAGILKAFPQAVVKLGGYTDDSGDARANQLLSQERAMAAKRALMSLGVASRRLLAVGYGAQALVASNAAPIGRALNRRLSLQVVSKNGPAHLPEPALQAAASERPRSVSSAQAGTVRQTRSISRPKVRASTKPRTKVGKWLQNLKKSVRGKRKAES